MPADVLLGGELGPKFLFKKVDSGTWRAVSQNRAAGALKVGALKVGADQYACSSSVLPKWNQSL